MENTRQLADLIATSAQQLELCPELAVSTFPPSREAEGAAESEAETAVELENYPFPITKGCYLAIERNYSAPFPAEMRNLAVLAADFCRISLVLTQLKSSKIVPISVIPTIAQMVPFWVDSRGYSMRNRRNCFRRRSRARCRRRWRIRFGTSERSL